MKHELNKLESNCGILRNAVGIHYAKDAYNGMVFGEQIEIDENSISTFQTQKLFQTLKREKN